MNATARRIENRCSRFAVRAPRSLVRCAPPSIELTMVFEHPMAMAMVRNTIMDVIGNMPMKVSTATYAYVDMISNAYEYAATFPCP